MLGAYLRGDRTVELREVPDPEPGYGQVVLAMRACTIGDSDLRSIYREHRGTGPEAYRGVIAGHEPAGEVVEVGPGVRRLRVGDRVAVYPVSGCGLCAECRRGYQVGCMSPSRAAYGWQRDGGHADLLLAEERDALPLPEELTWLDGACAACEFVTAYEALCRIGVSGRDRLLVTGLGPLGLAAGLLGKALGVTVVVGADPSPERRKLACDVGAVDFAVRGSDEQLTGLLGPGAETSIDCSGSGAGQPAALRHTHRWGRAALVGEGGTLTVDVSDVLIHRQLTVVGSWLSSTWRMAELLDHLARWDLHPEQVVTHRFALADAAEAYATADTGTGGKVGIVWTP
ncbi:alcohol dehydrogenase catalytic domain-containing protein [Geodermatophilus ruber]|uniref:Threonine dehydrogenase n=1 Tax=Geodermatophilus ruber TaxID=504800 RepID=A0A1I4IP73_9ACTN|nr:alcohol dehydrogenase catalytic domain-containing protein [Geodermatophilus ruber]SFL56152.1 Threonine dehydrogenase [Geodermatophilus ruber]